jgi:uncharacterized protein YdeI (BOF family)
MKNLIRRATTAFVIAAIPLSVAFAETLVKDLPDKGTVALSGTIDKVIGDREFILRDTSGAIDVKIANNQSLVLKAGEKVNLIGAVNGGMLGIGTKSVDASDVKVEQNLGAALADNLAATTGVSVDQAKSVRIGELPQQGMVKLLGTVDTVGDAKKFTLKDASGSVDVTIESEEKVALTKGAEVTVIGYVDSGLLGKKIHATRVVVSESAMPAAGT